MKVTIDIPDPVWFRIAAGAEAHGLTVEDVMAHAVRQVMPKRRPDGEDVLRLVRAGITDEQIAEALGARKADIARIRRDAGLARPKRPRTAAGITKTRRAA